MASRLVESNTKSLEIEFATLALNIHFISLVPSSSSSKFCIKLKSKDEREKKIWIKYHLSYPFTFRKDMRSPWIQNQHVNTAPFLISSPLEWSAQKTTVNGFLIFFQSYQETIAKITNINSRENPLFRHDHHPQP